MTIRLSSEIKQIIRNIEQAIIDTNYRLIGSENNKGRLTAAEIENIIKEYIRDEEKVTPAQNDYLDNLEAIVIKNTPLPSVHIDYDLWINNRHSDLTLSIRIQNNKGVIEPEILDLHVI